MSNPIAYDSLLVHYLAAELHDRLSGRRLGGARLDPDSRRLVLELDDARLVWDLHPTRGWLRLLPSDLPAGAAQGWGGRKVRTQRRPRVRRVHAPADERWLALELDAGGPDRASRLVVELMTNQWNVLALAPDGTILLALWPRDAGGRVLRPGHPYVPPAAGEPREGVEAPLPVSRWRALLDPVPPGDLRRALVRSVAWTSPLNAGAILGGDGLAEAWDRYAALASRPDPSPGLLAVRGGQPYPLPLPGVESRPAPSLLGAFEAAVAAVAAGAPGSGPGASGLAPEVRAALEARLARLSRRGARLRAEAEAAPEKAAALRRRADLLMAQHHAVRKGATEAELDDFEGGRVRVELDPALSPLDNARSLYEAAKKRERAAERLPARVRAAESERDGLASLLASLDAGRADPAELERWLREVRPAPAGPGPGEESLPYRRYRSSGGLEIRVGRSGRSNDELTFHHSAPDDVWLHARDVAGAHVILRWGDRDQNPPRRDLLEAAVLAALSSRARTSGTVPVDWTRRKYVRKPRKAPPGAVLPDRVSTLFVEPDPDLPARLGED